MKKFYSKNKLIFNALILSLVPILSVGLRLLIDGRGFGKVWLGASEWNDELFYFKQVECMVKDTVPLGYFGYNESHALVGSLGAWTPFLLIPYVIFGKIFGWGMYSPYICNILLLTIALFLFSLLAKPDFVKTVTIGGLLFLLPLPRYMLSAMTEIICIAPIVVLFGLLVGYENCKKKTAYFITELLLCFWLTLQRPYYAVFFLLIFIQKCQKKWLGRVVTLAVMALSAVLSLWCSSKLTAPYIGDVYSTAWIDTFFNEGPVSGIKFVFGELIHYTKAVLSASLGGILHNYAIGIYFGAYLVIMLILLVKGICGFVGHRKDGNLSFAMFICMVVFYLAIILMYSLQDGFRHLLAFIVAAVLLFAGYEKGVWKYAVIAGAFFLLTFVIKGTDPLYFAIPYEDESKEEIEKLKEALSKSMTVKDKLSYDNTVILSFMEPEEGELRIIPWQQAYGIPEGFGISLCTYDYLTENYDKLTSQFIITDDDIVENTETSKYIMVKTGGELDNRLLDEAMKYMTYDRADLLTLFYRNDKVSVYRLR